jgi:NAD(P)H-dependent FMN reductase
MPDRARGLKWRRAVPAPVLVVAGSTRGARRSLAVAEWVAELGRAPGGRPMEVVDLKALGLTLDDEPGLPALGRYVAETTRRWSARVAGAAGVVFVSPQYNWGYPAPLKNAIDHLYAEWKGKPGLIVTYGGHGGDKCAAQLRQVLQAVGMSLVPSMPGLRLDRARIEADDGAVDPPRDFAGHRDEVSEALQALLHLAQEG